MTVFRFGLLAATLFVAASVAPEAARAQFKEIKAAPFSPAIARQKIRAQLEMADPGNRDQVVATISAWLDWYRDILDEELIARWKSDRRTNLPLVMTPLADARVAREVVQFSWGEGREATFTPSNAAMLGDLMERYPDSGKPIVNDLLPQGTTPTPVPVLTPAEAEAVCRILVDMPDIGNWRKNALLILPRYRAAADQLLRQDMNSSDQEKAYRAQRWRMDLRLDPPPSISQKLTTRPSRSITPSQITSNGDSQRPHLIGGPGNTLNGYTGPMSGTFESTGDPIPQNGEYVFPNIPPVKLMLDFDTKHWEARLAPGEGQTQVLVLRNKGKGPQKKIVVHWTVDPS